MQKSISNTSKSSFVLICFLVGISLAAIFNDILVTLITSLILLLFFYFFIQFSQKSIRGSDFKEFTSISIQITYILGISFLILSSMYYLYRFDSISSNDISRYSPLKDIKITGVIDSHPDITSYHSAKMDFLVNNLYLNSNKISISGKAILNISNYMNKYNLKEGSIITVIGDIVPPRDASNPYEFDYKKYLRNNSITTLIYARSDELKVLGFKSSFWYSLANYLEILRSNIISIHSHSLTKDQSALLNGIVLGDNAAPLDSDLKQKFINSGLAHILAASGLNVALLAMLWVFITSKITTSKKVQFLGSILIVMFYTLLAGFTPSVLRSAIMLILVLLGKLFDKNANMIVLVLLAAFLLLIINPLMINDIGFQLSFSATLGLIVSIPIFQKYINTIPEYIAMLIIVPFVCQIWVMPILLFHFHYTSTFSIFSNVLAVPIVAILTYAGFITNVLGFIPFVNGYLVSNIDLLLSPLLSLLINIADYFSSLPSSRFFIPFSSLIYIFIYYTVLAILLIFMWRGVKIKYYAILISILGVFFAGCVLLSPKNNKLEIVFFDVGDADAIYIHSPSGKNIVIDCGKRFFNNSSSGKWIIEPFLYSRGIKSLDLVVLTHPENDHIGGIPELLNNFDVLNYVDSAFPSNNIAYNSVLRTIYKKNIPYTVLRQPDIVNLNDGLVLKIVNPVENARFKKSKNINSLAIILNYKHFNMLLAADTEKEQVFNLSNYNVDFNVIKVGHHGSKKSLSDKYLSLLMPEIAIISAGRTKYHPFPSTIKLLETKRINVFVTKDTGAIQLLSDGEKYVISTFRKDHFK